MQKPAVKLQELDPPGYACELGPEFASSGGNFEVRYDSETEDGSRVWSTLRFTRSIAFRFTPESGLEEYQVEGYNCVAEVPDSSWIESLRKKYQAVGHTLPANLRHFLVMFDHHGSIEVLALEFSIAG